MSSLEISVILKNTKGLHARASAKFVEICNQFKAAITVQKKGMIVSGASILELMMLAAECGEKLTIYADGLDAKEVLDQLQNLVNSKFGENE
jgi:phosphocarrier protein HPr